MLAIHAHFARKLSERTKATLGFTPGMEACEEAIEAMHDEGLLGFQVDPEAPPHEAEVWVAIWMEGGFVRTDLAAYRLGSAK
jgi:hypothetical protein